MAQHTSAIDFGSFDFSDTLQDSSAGMASLRWPGDFYREPEDVTRGVTFHESDLIGSTNYWEGDRSNASTTHPDVLKFAELSCHASRLPFEEGSIQGDNFKTTTQTGATARVSSPQWRCEGTAVLLDIPSDPFFELEETTVFLSLESITPEHIGNQILNLFHFFSAEIVKVDLQKFTIRAKAFVSDAISEVKVRMYRHSTGCAVEFQKCSGDGFAFAALYRIIASSLNSFARGASDGCADWSSDGPTFIPTLAVPTHDMQGAEGTLLQPLIDMASSGLPSLQLEAALGFAALVREPMRVEQRFVRPVVLKYLADFCRSGDLDAKLVSARALHSLADHLNLEAFHDFSFDSAVPSPLTRGKCKETSDFKSPGFFNDASKHLQAYENSSLQL